jgi:hypothetical protein
MEAKMYYQESNVKFQFSSGTLLSYYAFAAILAILVDYV